MFDLAWITIVEWFAWAVVDGVALGVFYDFIRAFKMLCGVSYFGEKSRKRIATRVIEYVITFFCDVLFFLVAGVVTLLLIYRMGEGLFRAFTFGGIISGFALYYFTVGKIVMLVSEAIIFFIRATLKVVLFIIFRPVFLIFRKIFEALKKMWIKIKTSIAKKRNIRYNENRQRELLSRASRGFFD